MSSQTPTLSEVISEAMDARLEQVFVAEPGRIVSFNADTCTANVQPTIKRIYTREDGTEFAATLPVIANVPVIFPGSGPDNGLTFPVKAGHTVLLVMCSTSLDSWKLSSNKIVAPKAFKPHALTDAVAIIGLRTLPDADDAAATFVSDVATVLTAKELCLGGFTVDDKDRVMRKEDATRFIAGLDSAINVLGLVPPTLPIPYLAAQTAKLALDSLKTGLTAVGWLNGISTIVKAVRS